MKQLDKILHQIEFSRKEKGFTQEKFAEVLGVDRTTYVRKENGRIPITLKEFLVIAACLKIQPQQFFTSIEKANKF